MTGLSRGHSKLQALLGERVAGRINRKKLEMAGQRKMDVEIMY